MATYESNVDNSKSFQIESQINAFFNGLIANINKRRDTLLKELHTKWDVFQAEVKTRENTKNDLENMSRRLRSSSITENFALQIQEKSLRDIEEQMKPLRKKLEEPNYIFIGSLNREFMRQIHALGDIIVGQKVLPIEYRKKTKPINTIGTKGIGVGEFTNPSRIYIDTKTNILYVPDSGNKRIQVFNVYGDFVVDFGYRDLQLPISIVNSGGYCYVCDHLQDCIVRYDMNGFQLVNKQNETSGGTFDKLKRPRGISGDSETNEILVADDNNRICVFDCDLNFVRDFGSDILNSPQFAIPRGDEIFVLDRSDPCLHVFNKNGDQIRSMISRGFGKLIRDGVSMCFDSEENILIADNGAARIRVFTPSGKVLHTISEGDSNEEEGGACVGVAVAGDRVFVVGSNDNILVY